MEQVNERPEFHGQILTVGSQYRERNQASKQRRCRPWRSNGECVGRRAIECSSFARTDRSRRLYTPTCSAPGVLSAAAATTTNTTEQIRVCACTCQHVAHQVYYLQPQWLQQTQQILQLHCVSKKGPTVKLSVTLPNLDRSSIFFKLLVSVWHLLQNPYDITHLTLWWAMLCGFCSKFHMLSSSAKLLKIG